MFVRNFRVLRHNLFITSALYVFMCVSGLRLPPHHVITRHVFFKYNGNCKCTFMNAALHERPMQGCLNLLAHKCFNGKRGTSTRTIHVGAII